uniref:Uncharacterized protein n=1 Tax=Parascaris univalens TaxID=6257 RepID=A0A915A4K0_PARUN
MDGAPADMHLNGAFGLHVWRCESPLLSGDSRHGHKLTRCTNGAGLMPTALGVHKWKSLTLEHKLEKASCYECDGQGHIAKIRQYAAKVSPVCSNIKGYCTKIRSEELAEDEELEGGFRTALERPKITVKKPVPRSTVTLALACLSVTD